MAVHVISGKSKNFIIVDNYQTVDNQYVSIALLKQDGKVGFGVDDDMQKSIDLSVEHLLSQEPEYKKSNVIEVDFSIDI